MVTAIEDGIEPTTLHAEVIAPALRRIAILCQNGEIDIEREHRATGITRRVLATLYRYMIGGTEPTRERVLLALAELRRAGVSADADYAGRSFKGQMTQAGRTGAKTVVIVRGDEAAIRRHGRDEQVVALDEVVATLTT